MPTIKAGNYAELIKWVSVVISMLVGVGGIYANTMRCGSSNFVS